MLSQIPLRLALALPLLSGLCLLPVKAEVVINELCAAQSERVLQWSSAGVPKLGMGTAWNDPAFNDAAWSSGSLPAGWGHAGMLTSLQTAMQYKTPSVYLRKTFTVSAADIAANLALLLDVEIDAGFVAFINGVEVARYNAGPLKHFIYASQPAYNASTNTGLQAISAGTTASLIAGTNVLCIQALNNDLASFFKINAGLRTASNTPVFIAPGTAGGAWKYFVGISEPSGGVFDPALVTFPIPTDEEDDFESPTRFVDWVELHNPGAAAQDLANWSLSDDAGAPGKWKFPAGTLLPAGGYMLVLCDDREEANGSAAYLHASFALSASGGRVAIYDPAGQLRDEVSAYPKQNSFYSFGRTPNASGPFAYQVVASPRAPNAGETRGAIAGTPVFRAADAVTDKPGSFYTGPQQLVLLSSTQDAEIRYTLDGTDPTETTGIKYAAAFTVSPVNDKTGVVVRARAFRAGMIPSETATNTYLLSQHTALKSLPAMILSGNAQRSFYAPYGIMSIVGGIYRGTDPNQSTWEWEANGPTSYNIPMNRGDGYERQISAEWRHPNGTPGFQDDAGVRISASPYSRRKLRLTSTSASPWPPFDANQKPSMNLYFRDDYGASKLDYPMFPGSEVQQFKHLRLRSGKNDPANPFILDELVRRLWIDLDWVGVRGRFCTVYVNGSFKGYYNITERIREPILQEYYPNSQEWDVYYINEIVDGSLTEWNLFQTRMATDLNDLAKYALLKEKADLEAIADYYILNIYAAMWDWATWGSFHNNYSFARERTSAGRWRPLVWDAEGAFGGNSASFDLITQNLIGDDDKGVLGNIWKRLVGISPFSTTAGSAEFRLLFADRVNKLMFNGGVLDDRTANNRFKFHKDSLAAEIQPVMTYVINQTLNQNFYSTWTNPTSGRRSYLLGPSGSHLRNAGVWPTTTPPVFSQFGGAVPAGYQLTISNVPSGGITYYTVDGSDPRLEGGAVAATAAQYAAPIPLTQVTTVKARSRSSGGEWSPITAAQFLVSTVAPVSNTLVISEIMYHPPDPSGTERAAGFLDADDFEFVRLTNLGSAPISLANVEFTLGITFDFDTGAVAAINPGKSVLVVRNKAAFQTRYGTTLNGMIAGEFVGRLNNAGERLTLEVTGTAPTGLHSFIYLTTSPWPEAPDGQGPSMILINPPDHSVGTNWIASAAPGGMPSGMTPSITYASWKSFVFTPTEAANAALSGPSADLDNDGLSNWAEYALGGMPKTPDAVNLQPRAVIVQVNGVEYLALTYTAPSSAADVKCVVQVSRDLTTWLSGSPATAPVGSPVNNPNGSATYTVRDTQPLSASGTAYMRLLMTVP